MLSLCCLCTGGIQMYGGMWTPPLSDKVSFLCVVYVQGAAKHHPNIWGHPNIGAVQTYRGHSNIGSTQTYGGIQTYRGASKHMWASKCMGAYGHPLSLMLSLCCVCTGDIQTYGGTPFFCIILNCICHLEFLLSCFFFNFTYFIHFFKISL